MIVNKELTLVILHHVLIVMCVTDMYIIMYLYYHATAGSNGAQLKLYNSLTRKKVLPANEYHYNTIAVY